MANDGHVALLKQEVDAWNAWENRNIRPNLRGADLCEASLHGADLCEAELGRAYLYRANLTGINLTKAKLHARIGRQCQRIDAQVRPDAVSPRLGVTVHLKATSDEPVASRRLHLWLA